MILGLGSDVIEIARIAGSIERFWRTVSKTGVYRG